MGSRSEFWWWGKSVLWNGRGGGGERDDGGGGLARGLHDAGLDAGGGVTIFGGDGGGGGCQCADGLREVLAGEEVGAGAEEVGEGGEGFGGEVGGGDLGESAERNFEPIGEIGFQLKDH